MAGTVDVLQAGAILQAQQHRLPGRSTDRFHDVGQRTALEHALLYPAAKHRDAKGRLELPGLGGVVEIAQIEQAL